MDIGRLISAYRKDANMTIDELATKSGVPKGTLNKIISGDTKSPTLDNVRAIAQALGKRLADFDDSLATAKKAPLWSSEAEQVARDYDSLDSWGRRAVRNTLDFEMVRTQEDRRLLDMEEDEEPKVIPLFLSPAAAGVASPILGEEYDDYTLGPEDPPEAMFAVRIQGDSMEPYFPDESVVFCNKDGLRDGDVGVFALDGGTVCKQYYKDQAGAVYLFSLNRARADADVLLMPHSGRNLVCLGRVLTKQRFPLPGRE